MQHKCSRYHRKITDAESIKAKLGPICRKIVAGAGEQLELLFPDPDEGKNIKSTMSYLEQRRKVLEFLSGEED